MNPRKEKTEESISLHAKHEKLKNIERCRRAWCDGSVHGLAPGKEQTLEV